jgi:hypothetical protein
MKKLIILVITGLIAVTQVNAVVIIPKIKTERIKAKDVSFTSEQIDTSKYLYKYSENGTILVIPKPVEPTVIDTLHYDTTTWKRFKLSIDEKIKLLNGESLEKTEESKTNANVKYLFLIYTQDKIERFRLTKDGFSSVSTQINPKKLDLMATWPIVGLVIVFIISILASSSSIPGSIYGIVGLVSILFLLNFGDKKEGFMVLFFITSLLGIAMSAYSLYEKIRTGDKHLYGVILMLFIMFTSAACLIFCDRTNFIHPINNIPAVYPTIYIIIGLYLGSIVRIMIKNHKS